MLKTHPRKRSIRKLFVNIAVNLFGLAQPYSETNFLTSVLKDFTLASFPAKNPTSSVFEVLFPCLVFAYWDALILL